MSDYSEMPSTSKQGGNEEELSNFLRRVDDITSIFQGLASKDKMDQKRAIRRADILLHSGKGEGSFDGGEPQAHVVADRTSINKTTEAEPSTGDDGDGSCKAFIKMVEQDAAQRAALRCEDKKESDLYRSRGNEAFRKCNYAEALNNFNKAIRLIKDSPCLYTNRGLTYIKVGIPTKALEDFERALHLNPKSLKARLLKARAYFNLSEPEQCRQWLRETLDVFPGNELMIKRYEEDLFELRMDLNEAYDETKKSKKSKSQEPTTDELRARLHEVTDGETLWLKASRGDLGHSGSEDETKP